MTKVKLSVSDIEWKILMEHFCYFGSIKYWNQPINVMVKGPNKQKFLLKHLLSFSPFLSISPVRLFYRLESNLFLTKDRFKFIRSKDSIETENFQDIILSSGWDITKHIRYYKNIFIWPETTTTNGFIC